MKETHHSSSKWKNVQNRLNGYTCFRLFVFYCFLTLFVLVFKFYLYDRLDGFRQSFIIAFNSAKPDNDGSGACQLPVLDPFDKSILKFVSHPRSMTCKQIQENITYIDVDGFLRFNESGVVNLAAKNITYSCYYRTFERKPGIHDHEIKFDAEKLLTKPVKLTEDMVEVTCRGHDKDSVPFYKNYHVHPADKPDRIFAKSTDSQLSLLFFYIDSISYSVLQRNLPATFNYTKNVMKITYFKGFNKIGDNSYPNLMAILTGKRVYTEQDDMPMEMDVGKTKFDAWPLAWKLFTARGYATMFNEDVPQWGLFHYLLPGFAKKPVDYYYHTYWMAMRAASHNRNFTHACFANQPNTRIFLDVAKRHLISLNDSLQFMYNFNTELSHDYVNEVERFDDDLVAFWREMHQGGYLNKTIIVFGSDHGSRYSSVRSTLIGLLEERMPFFGLWFPDWFYRLHPNIKENLKHNENLFTTSFDVFETLKDIAEANYDDDQFRNKKGGRGMSQLYPLPKNRTCQEAGVADHFCICSKETPLDKDSKLAMDIGSFLVEHLNKMLKENATNLCQTIKLTQIQYAHLVDLDEKLKQGVKSYALVKEMEEKVRNKTLERSQFPKNYRISIDTEPFGAKFEALVQVTIVKETNSTVMQVDGSVSRTNSYKGLSDCIDNAELRKFCSCKSVKIDFRNSTIDG